MDYRREIDGLRALAVLPVMLFHADPWRFAGGFVGVDVFLVISGYLITALLLAEWTRGTLRLADFYARRVRRLLPALVVVLAACVPLAWWLLLPQDMRAFGYSLAAAAGFMSNFVFWSGSGYFDTSAQLKPLLHTWSLGLEAQFYLLFPLLLLVALRRGRRVALATVVVFGAASLLVAEGLLRVDPAAAFYLLPGRFWEFAVGACVALQCAGRSALPEHGRAASAGALAGLAMITAAMWAFDARTPHPGLPTLLPVIGTALVILFAGPANLAGRLLGSRPLVWVGLISYGAYLWHQPLFAFARHYSLDEPQGTVLCALGLLALALAWLTWRWVERPVRSRRTMARRSVAVPCVRAVVLVVLGLFVHKAGIATYWEQHHPELVNAVTETSMIVPADCSAELRGGAAVCSRSGGGARRVVLWGDSHAGILSLHPPAVDDTEVLAVYHLGCPPVLGVRRFDGLGNAHHCDSVAALRPHAEFVRAQAPDAVVLAARWSLYLNGWSRDGRAQDEHHLLAESDGVRAPLPLDARKEMLSRKLSETLDLFDEGTHVILLAQPPDYAWRGFRAIERADFDAPAARVLEWHAAEREVLQAAARRRNVTLVDPKALFCDALRCRTREAGVLLYFDDNHLSPLGAATVWRQVFEAVEAGPSGGGA